MGSIAEIIARIGGFLSGPSSSHAMAQLTPTQDLFCQWNAERLGIPVEESRARFLASWKSIPDGHGGKEFRRYCDTSYQLFRVFADDSPREIYEAYQFHAPMHFLRMLSYAMPTWEYGHPVVRALKRLSDISIVDFGCGLAHRSRSLAEKLIAEGHHVTLILVDIPTLRKPFLLWLCEQAKILTRFLDCSAGVPIPKLPLSHVCIATDVFEHLHEPLAVFEAIDRALASGAFLVTDVHDHKSEYMHVSPRLGSIRERLVSLNYEEIEPERLYRKRPA